MTTLRPPRATLRLRAETWLWRNGWGIPLIAILAATALVAHLARHELARRHLASSIEARQLQERLARLAASPAPAPRPSPDATTMRGLDDLVYRENDINRLVRRVLEVASLHQIGVPASDYRLNVRGFAGLHQQQLTLPVQASYPQVKAFVLQLLGEHPGMSIDQLALRREDVSLGKPEVTIKASIWTRPGGPAARPASTPRKAAP